MWNNAFQRAYLWTPNLVMVATLTDSLVVYVGKTHVFVIMTMNNRKRHWLLTLAPLCKNSNLLLVRRFLHMAWVTYPTKGVI